MCQAVLILKLLLTLFPLALRYLRHHDAEVYPVDSTYLAPISINLCEQCFILLGEHE